jgi:hypothetical protein
MKSLVKKLQATKLFSDAQKVEIFALLEDASAEDKKKLEEGIDAFDMAYAKAVTKHTAQIQSVLGHMENDMTVEEREQNQDAIDQIKLGLAVLQS